MKGHDWQKWTTVYSLLALPALSEKLESDQSQKDLIDDFLTFWKPFVSACHSLSTPSILVKDVETIASNLMEFSKTILESANFGKRIAGYGGVNFHLVIHLAAQLEDWACSSIFSNWQYERFNGEIAEIKTNHIHANVQAMRSTLLRQLEAREERIPPGVLACEQTNTYTVVRRTAGDVDDPVNQECWQYRAPGWTVDAVNFLNDDAEKPAAILSIAQKNHIVAYLENQTENLKGILQCRLYLQWETFPIFQNAKDKLRDNWTQEALIELEERVKGMLDQVAKEQGLGRGDVSFYFNARIGADIYGSALSPSSNSSYISYRPAADDVAEGQIVVFIQIRHDKKSWELAVIRPLYDDRDQNAATKYTFSSLPNITSRLAVLGRNSQQVVSKYLGFINVNQQPSSSQVNE